jgi:CRISPR-associated protein Cas1
MTERILDISDRPAYLSVRNELLVVRFASVAAILDRQPNGGEDSLSRPLGTAATESAGEHDAPYVQRGKRRDEVTMPLTDLAALIVSHPQVTYTHAVLSGLAAAGAIFVACNEKHLPAAMLLPLVSHSTQTERFAKQAALPLPTRKRLWQQIVRAKLLAQGRLLEERTGRDWGLRLMAGRVRSGDAGNLESQAARAYWQALFSENFRRDPEGEGVNALLNYGYAVVRAIVTRALCGAGLHPSFGVHHHNRYDAFCLADDLMEPFRPLVDRVVAKLRDERGSEVTVDKDSKRAILEGLLGRFTANQESRTLFDWASRAACSLAAVIEGREEKLNLSDLTPDTCNL